VSRRPPCRSRWWMTRPLRSGQPVTQAWPHRYAGSGSAHGSTLHAGPGPAGRWRARHRARRRDAGSSAGEAGAGEAGARRSRRRRCKRRRRRSGDVTILVVDDDPMVRTDQDHPGQSPRSGASSAGGGRAASLTLAARTGVMILATSACPVWTASGRPADLLHARHRRRRRTASSHPDHVRRRRVRPPRSGLVRAASSWDTRARSWSPRSGLSPPGRRSSAHRYPPPDRHFVSIAPAGQPGASGSAMPPETRGPHAHRPRAYQHRDRWICTCRRTRQYPYRRIWPNQLCDRVQAVILGYECRLVPPPDGGTPAAE
jgi:hypothetical protein